MLAWASTTSANPSVPPLIAFFDTSGPYSAAFMSWFVDGEHAHLSTGAADFQLRHPLDDQFSDGSWTMTPLPSREAGRWWIPGIREGDDAPPPVRHPRFDSGHRVHNTNVHPEATRPMLAVFYSIRDSLFFFSRIKSRPRVSARSTTIHHLRG